MKTPEISRNMHKFPLETAPKVANVEKGRQIQNTIKETNKSNIKHNPNFSSLFMAN